MKDMHVFDLYFAAIVGFQYHPANYSASRMTLEEAAEIALQCMGIRDRITEELRPSNT